MAEDRARGEIMANELDEVTGPVNPAGNPVGDPKKSEAARGIFFGSSDKRSESQFPNMANAKPYEA